MKKRTIALLAVMVFALAVAIIAAEANKVYLIADFTKVGFASTADTTVAVNANIDTTKAVTDIPLGRIYHFIFQIDSVKSNSDSVGYRGSDSSYHRLKVQSSYGTLGNRYWADICSVTTGSSGADTATVLIEKVLLAVADTTVAVHTNIGHAFRVIAMEVDSTSSPVAADLQKRTRVFGSVEVAVRH